MGPDIHRQRDRNRRASDRAVVDEDLRSVDAALDPQVASGGAIDPSLSRLFLQAKEDLDPLVHRVAVRRVDAIAKVATVVFDRALVLLKLLVSASDVEPKISTG